MKIILLFALIQMGSIQARAKDCEIVRAAFDLGSGSTKMKVARVDTCQNPNVILEVLLDEKDKVPFKQDLDTNGLGGRFSESIQTQGVVVIKGLIEKAKAKSATEFVGVATQAFRESKNTGSYFARLKNETGLNARVISQTEEGESAFRSVLAKDPKLNPKSIVVWDIGGASHQLICDDPSGKRFVYHGNYGAESFKRAVLEKVKKQRDSKSPNPLTKDELNQALDLAIKMAKESKKDLSFKPIIESKLKDKNTIIIGVGGVHGAAIGDRIKSENGFYSVAQIEERLFSFVGMKDEEIKDPRGEIDKYAATVPTNFAMVRGMIEGYQIKAKQIQILNLDLTEDILRNSKPEKKVKTDAQVKGAQSNIKLNYAS